MPEQGSEGRWVIGAGRALQGRGTVRQLGVPARSLDGLHRLFTGRQLDGRLGATLPANERMPSRLISGRAFQMMANQTCCGQVLGLSSRQRRLMPMFSADQRG